MIKYQNIDTGEIFDEQYEAYDEISSEMTWDDYEEYFSKMNFHDLFTRVRELADFWEKFQDDLCAAEQEYFEANYKEIEVEEEE